MEKVDRHLSILNGIRKDRQSKNDWIIEALQDKLAEPEVKISEKRKILNIRLDEELHSEIEKAIDRLKKPHGSFTKRQLVAEAIQKKLIKEKALAKDAFTEMAMQDIYS